MRIYPEFPPSPWSYDLKDVPSRGKFQLSQRLERDQDRAAAETVPQRAGRAARVRRLIRIVHQAILEHEPAISSLLEDVWKPNPSVDQRNGSTRVTLDGSTNWSAWSYGLKMASWSARIVTLTSWMEQQGEDR